MSLCLVPLPETIPVKYTEEEAEYISMRPLVRQEFRSAELVDMIVQVAGKDPGRVQKILSAGTIVFHSFRYWWAGFEADAAALNEILKKYPDPDPQRAFRAEECAEVILDSRDLPAVAGLSSVTSSANQGGSRSLPGVAGLPGAAELPNLGGSPTVTGLPPVAGSQPTAISAAVANSSSEPRSPARSWRVAGSPARHSLRIRRDEANKRKLLRSRTVWDVLMDLVRESAPVYREYSYSLRGDVYALGLSPERAATLARDATQTAPRALRAELATLPKMSQIIFICPRTATQSTRSPI